MTKLNNYAHKIYQYGTYLISSAMVFSLFSLPPIPSFSTKPLPLMVGGVNPGTITTVETTPIKDAFFGLEASTDAAESSIQKQIELVTSRKAYPASLGVIKKHEQTIRSVAQRIGVPEDVALGVALLENGGSETAVSKAGALGIFQLMPGTARSLGLTVTKKKDDRKDPEKNIEAGITYLRKNYDRFGDWGLSTWAYHAGEGNVAKALKIYAKENHGVNLPGVRESKTLREYVAKHGLTVHKLLSHSGVKKFTAKLSDDSHGYPYKVAATATLFKQAQ